jgi:hypothetical protein
MDSESAARRLYPHMIDAAWLLRSAIEAVAARVAADGQVAIDLGCGSQPYRSILPSRGLIYRGADTGSGDFRIVFVRVLASALAVIMNVRCYIENLITPHCVRRDTACVYVPLSRAAGSAA